MESPTLSPVPGARETRAAGEAHCERDPHFHPRRLALQGRLNEPPRETRIEVAEDDFSQGLGRWTGDTATWKLDVAGVRPAALALFEPSLGSPDYRLEFLARIERGTLRCVFRANGDERNELRIGCGSMERGVVAGGEWSVSAIIPVPAAQTKSLTISITASGDLFSISVNGKETDRWNDARLPSGGIGFAAGPEDRARLYWVKLSPLEPEISQAVRQP